MNLKKKYGHTAMVAGASEGLGAAWAETLAKKGFDLVLIARRKDVLEEFASTLSNKFSIRVIPVTCDLSDDNALEQIVNAIGDTEISFLVYNAALSFINPFLKNKVEEHLKLATVNILSPIKLLHYFGEKMVSNRRGGIVLMSSLAGFQGSGFLTTYAASKAFNRVLAEGLWYEWKNKGVDVLGCCAGATSTPNYINTKPGSISLFAPKEQTPEEVVEECLNKIGTSPSFITGSGNRLAYFFMNKIFSAKMAVNTISNTTKKMYDINW